MKKVTVCLLILLCLAVLPVSAMALNAASIAEGAIKAVSKASSSVIIQSKLSPVLIKQFERIGGKAMVAKAEKIATMHGASALKVVSNNPRLISALDRFGFRDQSKLLNALSRKPDLANAARKYGDDILKLELRSNGQAMRIVRTFGEEGVRLGAKLTDKQLEALVLATNKFKNASPKVIKAFLDMVGKYTGKVFDFLEKHPKVLYTATAAGLVVNMKENLFGDPETGTPGAVQQVAAVGKDGIVETAKVVISPFAKIAEVNFLWILAALLILGLFRGWWSHRRKQNNQQAKGRGFSWFKRNARPNVNAEVVEHA